MDIRRDVLEIQLEVGDCVHVVTYDRDRSDGSKMPELEIVFVGDEERFNIRLPESLAYHLFRGLLARLPNAINHMAV